MKTVLMLGAAALALAGCTLSSGAKFSSEHGYCVQGQFDDGRFAGAGCPTIVPDGFSAMGSKKHNPDGTVDEEMFSTIVGSDGSSATGNAADIVAETGRLEQMLLLCAVAPTSNACLGG
jgi:hypothetical protein